MNEEYEETYVAEEFILLPISRESFELLLKEACEKYALPVDDAMRTVLAGYIHHIRNDQNVTTIRKLAQVLYKSVSNKLTWEIDQEIKQKNRQKLEELTKEQTSDLPIA